MGREKLLTRQIVSMASSLDVVSRERADTVIFDRAPQEDPFFKHYNNCLSRLKSCQSWTPIH